MEKKLTKEQIEILTKAMVISEIPDRGLFNRTILIRLALSVE